MTVSNDLSNQDDVWKFFLEALNIKIVPYSFPIMYKGELTHDLTKHFAALTDTEMEKAGAKSSTKRKVYHTIIELLQNITHHSDDFQTDEEGHNIGNGMLLIGKKEENYFVITGNLIANTKIEKLKEQLGNLNNTDEQELKQLFKKQMREGKIDEKGGAGLGLIDLLRKTKRKFSFGFTSYDDDYQFFINSLTIPASPDNGNSKDTQA